MFSYLFLNISCKLKKSSESNDLQKQCKERVKAA